MNILAEIFAHKVTEVEQKQRAHPLAEVRAQAERSPRPLAFIDALRRTPGQRPALIAEVKQASPSRGTLTSDFDPLRLARLYQHNGASAISVLTDERYFKGSLDNLRQIAELTPRLPLLRKDFIYDPYQVYEARAAGADAVLLIAAHLEPARLRDLHALVHELGMAALVEVHTAGELAAAVEACRPPLVGINNRNLQDFSVSLETTLHLAGLLPTGTCRVAESGIHTPADIDRVAAAGVDAVLVGEALVTAPDAAAKVRSMAR